MCLQMEYFRIYSYYNIEHLERLFILKFRSIFMGIRLPLRGSITQMAGEEHYDSGLRLRRNGGQREYIKVYIWWPLPLREGRQGYI